MIINNYTLAFLKRSLFLRIFLISLLAPSPLLSEQEITLSGPIELQVFEDAQQRVIKKRYTLLTHRKKFEIHFDSSQAFSIIPGVRYIVRGKRFAPLQLKATALQRDKTQIRTAFKEIVSGPRRVAAIVMQYQGETLECNREVIERYLWEGDFSSAKHFETWSEGKITFEQDVNKDSLHDVFFVTTSGSLKDSCDTLTSRTEEAYKQVEASGVKLSDFQHIIYFQSGKPDCGYLGIASVGCTEQCSVIMNTCREFDDDIVLPSLLHELGHNFGWAHASLDADNNREVDENGEYEDNSCVMGGNPYVRAFPNAVHLDERDWIPEDEKTTIYEGGEFELAPLAEKSGIRLVRFPIVGADSGEHYYLSYRQPTGDFERALDYNDETMPYHGKLSIHTNKELDTYWWDDSLLLQFLSPGESFVDKYGDVTVTLLEAASAHARVRIETPNPLPTPAPDDGDEGTEYYQFSGLILKGSKKRHQSISLGEVPIIFKDTSTGEKHTVYADADGSFLTILYQGNYKIFVPKKIQRKLGIKALPRFLVLDVKEDVSDAQFVVTRRRRKRR